MKLSVIIPSYKDPHGGCGGKMHKTTRDKLRKARLGKKGTPHTKEFKKKLSKRSIGNTYSLGRKQTKEEKQKHKKISANYTRGTNGRFIKKR